MVRLIKASNKPAYTFLITCSREWVFPLMAKKLRTMVLPYEITELVVCLDHSNASYIKQWGDYLEALAEYRPYNGIRLCATEKKPIAEDAPVHHRRNRIIEVHEWIKDYIGDTEWLFLLEDDTECPDNAFEELMNWTGPEVGLVQGVLAGRWGIKMVGAWGIEENEAGEPIRVRTLPVGEGVQEVQGAGWYCLVTPTLLFKELKREAPAECLGPDVSYAYGLYKRGLKVLTNWNVRCVHHLQSGRTLTVDNIQTISWEKADGRWRLLSAGDKA